jgi:hypothetical protein
MARHKTVARAIEFHRVVNFDWRLCLEFQLLMVANSVIDARI